MRNGSSSSIEDFLSSIPSDLRCTSGFVADVRPRDWIEPYLLPASCAKGDELDASSNVPPSGMEDCGSEVDSCESSSSLKALGPSATASSLEASWLLSNCCLSNDLASAGDGYCSDLLEPKVSSSFSDKAKEGLRCGISGKTAARDHDRAKFSKLFAPPACAMLFILEEMEDLELQSIFSRE